MKHEAAAVTPYVVIPDPPPPWVVDAVAELQDVMHAYVGDHRELAPEEIVAVVDADPSVVIAATARGIDGILLHDLANTGFSWHFRARRDDLKMGLERRLKEWTDRREARSRAWLRDDR